MNSSVEGEKVTILIAEDHTLLREALRESLEGEDDLAVIGEAGSGESAVQLAGDLRPDVILMDVEMPGETITGRILRIKRNAPGTRVIILTMHDEPRLVKELLNCGVHGYLLKTVSRMELISAIRAVTRHPDRLVVSVSQRSLDFNNEPAHGLTQREVDVLGHVAEGLSNAQIAARLFIAEGTVKRHLRNIFDKLGAASRTEAVNKASQASLLRGNFGGPWRRAAG
ncbi:response regulator [Streptomyces sp. NPDC052396]|uniref:response regulator transcription factor n=1 Tax=Streptomyces sp. NPDC052396 TaxID=3365689 RepID=UPI0037D8D61D